MTKTCPVCGETFEGKGSQIYCSYPCYKKAQKKRSRERTEVRHMTAKICEICGKEFMQKSATQIYCCAECRKEAIRIQKNKWSRDNLPPRHCKWCGTQFVPKEKTIHHFCSPRCEEEYKVMGAKPKKGKVDVDKATRDRKERAELEAVARAHGMHYGTYTAFLRMQEQAKM